MEAPRAATGIALACLCLVILGIMPIIANSRPPGFDALAFAFLLSVWQLIFALPLFLWEVRSSKGAISTPGFDPRKKSRILVVGLVTGMMFGLSTYLYVLGVQKAGAVSAAIAIQAYPLFAILWETIFLKRRKTIIEMAFTAVLIGALCYLATDGTWRVRNASPWFFLALGVPFLWSVAHVIIREELRRTPITPAQITFFRVLVSAVFLGLVLAVTRPGDFAVMMHRPDYQVFGMIMGLVYYLELIVWFHALRHIDVSLASSITTPWPAVTMVLAVLFLGNRVETHQIVAFMVIAASLYGLLVAGARKARGASTGKAGMFGSFE